MIPPPKPLLEGDLCPLNVGHKITSINHNAWYCESSHIRLVHARIGPPYPLPRIFSFSPLDGIAVVYSLDMEPWCNYMRVQLARVWRTSFWPCVLGATTIAMFKNQVFNAWNGFGEQFAGVDFKALCVTFRVPPEAFTWYLDSPFKDPKDSKYPSICQACNSPAYISNQFIECSNSACKWAGK